MLYEDYIDNLYGFHELTNYGPSGDPVGSSHTFVGVYGIVRLNNGITLKELKGKSSPTYYYILPTILCHQRHMGQFLCLVVGTYECVVMMHREQTTN